MKKIFSLFAIVGLLVFSGCSDDDNDVDYDTISGVFDVTNVSFTSENDYSKSVDNPSTFSSDVILVYRSAGVETNGNRIWKLLPETYFTDDRGLDFTYTFQFSNDYIDIFMDGFDLDGVNASFRLNQVFRIVIVPGSMLSKNANKPDYSDYNAVIKKYNINDKNVKLLE
jgi:hypothetical protein